MITVYGLKNSYFTGKLEGYLRYKEIPYGFHSLTGPEFTKMLPEKTGALQMPAITLSDGRWITDTTPMIDWFETQYTDAPILPADPVQAFICKLLEDYADEWQWRPAMHYRWSYPLSAKCLAHQLADMMGGHLRIPAFMIRRRIERRQRQNFVVRDGVNGETWAHMDQAYIRLLGFMREVLKTRSYVFGERPTLADIGLFGPLFRHYAMDPYSGAIMREDYPEVMEWVYRLWNAKASTVNGPLVDGIPQDIVDFLTEVAETHLEALCANATARGQGQKLHNPVIQGVAYEKVPTSQYRIWCLEQLQAQRLALAENDLTRLDAVRKESGALEPLTRLDDVQSGYNTDGSAPFGRSLAVYETLV